MDKYNELADLIFPNVTETLADLEKRYPVRNIDKSQRVTRFAPSPTGFLHTGSLFVTLVDYIAAKQSNGVFYIRLEDTDQKREIEGSGKDLIEQLKVFGLVNDEGYFGDEEKGNYGPYVQSKRKEIYDIVLKEMIRRNKAYPCFCTEEELTELRKVQEVNKVRPGYYGIYAKYHHFSPEEAIKLIKEGKPYVIRFKSEGNEKNKYKAYDEIKGQVDITENDQDIVICKSDGLPTYHFAHLVDDHFMGTTHVIRGEEWLPSLPIHLQLFQTLGWESPAYCHLPVIMKIDENGTRRKLSKRKDKEAATSFFIEAGYPTEGFLEYLMTVVNSNFEEWREENKNLSIFDFPFRFDKMSLDGALFDMGKVSFICKEVLSRMNAQEISEKTYEWSKKFDKELQGLIERDFEYFKSIMNIEREKENPRKDYEKYGDIKETIKFFYDDYYNEMLNNELPWNPNISKEDIKNVLNTFIAKNNMDLDEENWFANLKEIASSCGFAANVKEYKKNKEAFKGHIGDVAEIIRIAITTRKQTPNLYFILKILGVKGYTERINKVINKL